MLFDHPIYRIAAATADADDLHARVLRCALLELEDHCGRNSTWLEELRGAVTESAGALLLVAGSEDQREDRHNITHPSRQHTNP
jgi:hypothetical protein